MELNSSRDLLFYIPNQQIKKIISKNVTWLALSQGVGKILKLIFFVFFARRLGAFCFGQFNFAFSFVASFSVLTDLGINQIFIREYPVNIDKREHFYSLFSFKIILAVTLWWIIFIASFLVSSYDIRQLIWVLGSFVALEALINIIFGLFQAELIISYQALLQILEIIFTVTGGIIIILYRPSLLNLGYTYLFSRILVLVLAILLVKKRVFYIAFRWNTQIWQKYLKLSWPLALSAILASIWANIDSVMMGFFGQIAEVGLYQAAYKIIATLGLPATLLATVFFPVLSNFYFRSFKQFRLIWKYFVGITFILSLFICAIGFLGADTIILTLYGNEYVKAIRALKILLLSNMFYMLSLPLSQLLILQNLQRSLLFFTLSATLSNVIINYFLIPRYSLYGASIATVISGFLLFLLLAFKNFLILQKYENSYKSSSL